MPLHNPTALMWIALGVPIVIFYLLKVKRRKVAVSTVMFWEEVFSEKQPRAIWRQLRHWLSLLLQLTFLGLLAVALADPYFSSDVLNERRIVVVLDCSASMQAADGTVSRFEASRGRLEQLIRSLRQNDQMAIIAAGSSVQVACGLTENHRTLRNAALSLNVTDAPASLDSAIAAGDRLLSGQEGGELVVLTDLPPDDNQKLQSGNVLKWEQTGRPANNVGITQFQVRRSLVDPVGFQTLVEVSNFSDQPISLRLQLKLNDDLLNVIPLSLHPGEIRESAIDDTLASGGILTASIDSEDAFAVDNTAFAVLPERTRRPVTLVTDGNWFLHQVLESSELVDLTVTASAPAAAPDGGVLVLHRPLAGNIPPGHVIVVTPVESSDLWQIAGTIPQPLVATQKDDSALMRHVTLQNVLLPSAEHIEPVGDFEALVETAEGFPLYARIPRESGDVLVLCIDLDQTDLPLRTAFPILMTNAVSWFSDDRGELIESLATGQVARRLLSASMRAAAEANGGRLPLIDPGGHQVPGGAGVTGQTAVIGPLSRTGIWTLRSEFAGGPESGSVASNEMKIACNLSNRTESDLRIAGDSAVVPASSQRSSGGHPIWFSLVLVAGCLLVSEWFLFQRRRIA
ncbi:MAG: BatA and WFA domain-containing protein [Planctomycetaceae bacterium]